jgi:hypothetical protein
MHVAILSYTLMPLTQRPNSEGSIGLFANRNGGIRCFCKSNRHESLKWAIDGPDRGLVDKGGWTARDQTGLHRRIELPAGYVTLATYHPIPSSELLPTASREAMRSLSRVPQTLPTRLAHATWADNWHVPWGVARCAYIVPFRSLQP